MACLLRNNQETEEVGVYGFSLFVSEEDAKPQLTLADHVFQTWSMPCLRDYPCQPTQDDPA